MQEQEEPQTPDNSISLPPARLNLEIIGSILHKVQDNWQSIESRLIKAGVSKKDTPFNSQVRENMLSAYSYLDGLLGKQIAPFSLESLEYMLALNNLVHYGQNQALMEEYRKAIQTNTTRFFEQVEPLIKWYQKHLGKTKIRKLAGEIYVSALGHPQLFIEGNHRTGSLIASWINTYYGYPPFVLSSENAVAYFQPSSEIKMFVDKATWRGRNKLPKYRKSFGELWETLTSNKTYLR